MTRTGTAPQTAIMARFNPLNRARILVLAGVLAIAAYSVAASTSLVDFVLRFAVAGAFAALAIWCSSVWWSVYRFGTKENSPRDGNRPEGLRRAPRG